MQNENSDFAPVPPKRYFTLDELCRLADIDPHEFLRWQRENGTVIGYGGTYYTRADVLRARTLRETFSPYINPFTRNRKDSAGNRAADADEVRGCLETMLNTVQSALARTEK